MHHIDNLAALLITIFEIIYSFGDLIIICEFGQRMNCALGECNEIIGQFEWYSFPVEFQRVLPLILNFAQQPVEVICFGSIICDREIFKYVRVMKISNHLNSNDN